MSFTVRKILGLCLCSLWTAGLVLGQSSEAPALAWMELTAQSSEVEPRLEKGKTAAGEPIRIEDVEPGLYLVCWGGDGNGVRCERRIVDETTSIARRPSPGVPVTGSIWVGREPGVEAEIQVAPHGLVFRRAFVTPLEWNPETQELRRSVSTGDDGSFTLPPLGAGDWFLEIQLPGGRIERSEPFTIDERWLEGPDGTGSGFNLGILRFEPGTHLEVFVLDSSGAPVADGTVGAMQGAQPLESELFEASVDETGRAVLTGLDPAAPLKVTCTAPGFTWARLRFDAPPATTTCSIEPLAQLRGIVVDVDEEPVEAGTVALASCERRTNTGTDGAFELMELVPGSHVLTLAAPGFAIRRLDVELEPGEDRNLGTVELLPGQELILRIVDAETGAPIEDASVRVVQPPGGGSATTDEDGEALLTTGSADSLDLDVEVRAPGYAVARRRIEPDRLGETEPLTLELQRAGRIEVRAWQDDGSPCVGCQATILGSGVPPISVRTGTGGRAVSDDLPPGRYQVNLTRERSLGRVVQVSGGDDIRWADVKPRQTVTVLFGEPAEQLQLRLGSPLPAGWKLRAQGAGWVRYFDPGQEMEVRRRPGEPVTLALAGPVGAYVQQDTIPGDYSARIFDVELYGSQLVGVLWSGESVAAGKPLVLLSTGSGVQRATARTGPDGAFVVPYLAPGTYVLQVDDQPVRSVSVAPGRVEDLGKIVLFE